ncbi:MAG: toprim domain-containing protein, partial [Methylobacter sp.]
MSTEFLPDTLPATKKQLPPSAEHTAETYLENCGFDLTKLNGWYDQGNYGHPRGNRGTNTVRFFLDESRQLMWERLIDPVTISIEGKRETVDQNAQGLFDGLWWQPPGLEINEEDRVFLCTGIFDAIAFNHNGHKAVAIMSHKNFPTESIEQHLGKNVKWRLAIGNDKNARYALRQHAKRLQEMEELVGAVLSSEFDENIGWDHLYKTGKLTAEDMTRYRYFGKLELAKNAYDKARVIWDNNQKKRFFVFTFINSTYSFNINPDEYDKAHKLAHERDPLTADQLAFDHASKIDEIATFRMEFLYFQKPENGEDGQYFFRLNFSNKADEEQIALGGNILAGAGDFKKVVGLKNPSALYKGKTEHLDFLRQNWMKHIPKIVSTLDFMGYDRNTGAYVYKDYAVQDGKLIELNKESFFELKK